MPWPSRSVVTADHPIQIATAARGFPGAADDWPLEILVKNVTATEPIYIGGTEDVTPDTGFKWEPTDGALQIRLTDGEDGLYGILAEGGSEQILHVLQAVAG